MKIPKSLITSILFSTRNKLKTSEDIRELESCKKLSVLDISYNSLEEPEVLEVLAKMPELHVLTSTGNPIIRKTRDYRRNVLYRRVCKKKLRTNICILEMHFGNPKNGKLQVCPHDLHGPTTGVRKGSTLHCSLGGQNLKLSS